MRKERDCENIYSVLRKRSIERRDNTGVRNTREIEFSIIVTRERVTENLQIHQAVRRNGLSFSRGDLKSRRKPM